MSHPKFGPAGAGEQFYNTGHKSSLEMPVYLSGLGLDCFEYQCGRGVNISADKAVQLGEKAKEYGVALSIHAPYFISLNSPDPEKRQNSIRYLLESTRALSAMGGKRVIFHPGGLGKQSREEAFAAASETLVNALQTLENEGLGHILLCPETMGKNNQLGDLEETVNFCKLSDRLLPCVDFGHLNSRTQGGIDGYAAYEAVFDTISNGIGTDKARRIHCHFSKIEYTAGGEKNHLTFAEDTHFGPDYEPLMELLYKKNYAPVIICESRGTQEIDAKTMKSCYISLTNNK